MACPIFQIKDHVVDCQYIREYARATSNAQDAPLKLAVKQYIPLDNLDPQEGDITIIGAHANGFPKELYEPFWEDIHARSKKNGFKIRSIWIADIAQEGASFLLNEDYLGNDPSWLDHARDLLHMINTFRMPLPIIGIGHSFGGNMLTNLSLMHPRLLSSLILVDPVIQGHASAPGGPAPAQLSAFRRDVWPSRSAAEAAFRSSKAYASWDKRVLDRWCQYSLRETPTPLFPNEPEGSVTLVTTKHQECFSFLRASWDAVSPDGEKILDRNLVPDLSLQHEIKYPFYRPEPPNTLTRLPELRPSVLYVFGGISPMSAPVARQYKMDHTGIGTGGSGGAKDGKVKQFVVEGVGHLVPMEASELCADAAAEWLGKEAEKWKVEMEKYKGWTKLSREEKTTLSEEWKRMIGGPLRRTKSQL